MLSAGSIGSTYNASLKTSSLEDISWKPIHNKVFFAVLDLQRKVLSQDINVYMIAQMLSVIIMRADCLCSC